MSINPWNNKCCATCRCLMIKSEADDELNRHLVFDVSCDCPHANGKPFKIWAGMNELPLHIQLKDNHITDVSALFDFVCNSWEGRGEPLNLDNVRCKGEKV